MVLIPRMESAAAWAKVAPLREMSISSPLRGACLENRESGFSGLFEILLPSRSVSRHMERSR